MYWEKAFAAREFTLPKYDNWLEKHLGAIRELSTLPILDLGCGSGADSLFLTNRKIKTIGADVSQNALVKTRKLIPGAMTIQFDFRDGLPFRSASAGVIIADLSLHYFPRDATRRIFKDLAATLSGKGIFLCRRNSVHDKNHGAGEGNEVEPGLFENNGHYKRFFDKQAVESLFDGWTVISCAEYTMTRYDAPKILWEIRACKPEGII
jgi:SAM-dependent methyltransferase